MSWRFLANRQAKRLSRAVRDDDPAEAARAIRELCSDRQLAALLRRAS